MAPQVPSTLPAIVAPSQTVVKDTFHTATQPIVHPINVVNQHHTIPVPQHFCAYSYSDVKCGMGMGMGMDMGMGMRAKTKGLRSSSKRTRSASTPTRSKRKSR
jgi:hypothetical protein